MNNVKRICHVVSGDLWGGAEAQVYQLSRNLLDMDYQVYVITLNKGVLFDKFSKLPITVVSFDENEMSLWAMIFRIKKFLKTNKIDLVHSHGFKENLLAGMAARLSLNCKVVRTHHGRGVVNASLAKVLVEKINAYFLTNILISVSYDLKEYLISRGYPKNKISVVNNGIDCESLSVAQDASEIRKKYSIPEGSFVIGTASRIEHEKGFEYLLLAVKDLIDKGLPVVFIIVGSGDLQQEFQELTEDLNIADSVIFTGFQKDVCSYLNVFDIFVMMSLNEGIPLALIEAMCMGKAVVCSEVGGIPEVVTSDVNGILVPSMDYRACASACEAVLTSKERREALGENAHKHVIENFSAKKSAELTINQYQRLLLN